MATKAIKVKAHKRLSGTGKIENVDAHLRKIEANVNNKWSNPSSKSVEQLTKETEALVTEAANKIKLAKNDIDKYNIRNEGMVKVAENLEGYYKGKNGSIKVHRIGTAFSVRGVINGDNFHFNIDHPMKIIGAIEKLKK